MTVALDAEVVSIDQLKDRGSAPERLGGEAMAVIPGTGLDQVGERCEPAAEIITCHPVQ